MIRQEIYDHYEPIIRLAFQQFLNDLKLRAIEPSDILVCQQGGHKDERGLHIGLGKVGINNFQKVNTINNIGSEILINDSSYFSKYGSNWTDGLSAFDRGIHKICNLYLDIWENELFLRNFAQLIKIANGKHYDWELDLSKLGDPGKNKFIREEIKEKLQGYPYLYEIVQQAYNSNLRNAIGHSQYHLIQGGIILDNYGRGKYATDQGFPYEILEKKVTLSWLIFRFLFHSLHDLATGIFLKLSKITLSGGIPILIPTDENWELSCIYPDPTGTIWRFVKY